MYLLTLWFFTWGKLLCIVFSRNSRQDFAVQEALSIFGTDFDFNEVEQSFEYSSMNSLVDDEDIDSVYEDDDVSHTQKYEISFVFWI